MMTLPLPAAPAGTVQEQAAQQYSYLVQMAQQLNLALGQLEELGSGAGAESARRQAGAYSEQAQEAARAAEVQYDTLRSMILKTAEQVEKTTEELTARLKEEYVASSDFGSYVAKLSAYLEANPQAMTQYYSFFSDLKANVEKVDAAFSHYKVDTEGYIRTGIVYYDGAVPVYGVAVGQDLTCREIDGQRVVEQSNFRAVFTASRLSFWQDATEVAYVSNNRLYITNITVLGAIAVGQWSVEAAEGGLAFRWIGGGVNELYGAGQHPVGRYAQNRRELRVRQQTLRRGHAVPHLCDGGTADGGVLLRVSHLSDGVCGRGLCGQRIHAEAGIPQPVERQH